MSITRAFPTGNTLVITAFSGWNDAGEAASDALDHLLATWDAVEVATISSDDYYDYQLNRPEVTFTIDGTREILWPSTTIYRAQDTNMPETAVYLVRGVEPSFRWTSFCTEIFSHIPSLQNVSDSAASAAHNTVLISLGSLLGDTPHTRPIPVHGSTTHALLQEVTGFETPSYEGPTGILGVIQAHVEKLGSASIGIWAAVPHYVSSPPCPMATLALVRTLEDTLNTSIGSHDLVEEAKQWQDNVALLAADDDEISEYVRSLEESQDTAELPEATGEAIAKEFERYLRRREN